MGRRWFLVDALVVVAFVAIGRSTHHHGLTVAGMTSTTWPFGVGLLAGWILVVGTQRRGGSVAAGVVVWLSTVALGMVLRVVSGQGTVAAFIAVALLFLGSLMLGLRALALVARRRGATRSVHR